MTAASIFIVAWGFILAVILFTPKGTMNMVWIVVLILIALSPIATIAFPSLR